MQKTDNRQLIDDLFLQMQAHLGFFFEHLAIDEIKALVDHLLEQEGTVILTGVGKSGIISKKIAMTMNSCGIQALYMSPQNALHGDIGMVKEGDTVLMLSKSGESDELLQLCPALRNKGVTLVAVVSSIDSRLEKATDQKVFLPVAKELCPYDLAPTTSTTVQLLFGDLVAICLMRQKEVSIDAFITNHPAGRIGKRLTFKVGDLMLQDEQLPLAKPDQSVVDVLVELSNKRSGAVLVVDDSANLLGIFTDGDLRRALQKYSENALSMKVSDVMTINPRTTTSQTLAYDAMCEMEKNQKGAITVMPVVDGKRLKGLIRLHDIVQSGL